MATAIPQRAFRLTALLLAGVLSLALFSRPAGAESPQPWEQQTYAGAQYVQISLGEANQEMGIRLIDGQPDGLTGSYPELGGRQSRPNQAGTERFFYFDVHDSYFKAGKNKLIMTVTYKDVGLTPIFLEYDAYDPLRPRSKADELIKKRIPVATRTNTEGWKTAYIYPDDARFAGMQPGGADFRIGSGDELVLKNVSVMLQSHQDAPRPIKVILEGKEVPFDPNEVEPFIDPTTSRTLVPFRVLFNALGVADKDIVWHNETRTVEARKGTTVIMLTIDAPEAKVNGQPVKLDQPARIVASRTVVPIRFVTEQFGLLVEWNAQENAVVLKAKPQDPAMQLPGSTPQQPGTQQPGTQQPGTQQPATQQPAPAKP